MRQRVKSVGLSQTVLPSLRNPAGGGYLLQLIRSKYTYKFKKAAPLPGSCSEPPHISWGAVPSICCSLIRGYRIDCPPLLCGGACTLHRTLRPHYAFISRRMGPRL
jgi:hypothetical protein